MCKVLAIAVLILLFFSSCVKYEGDDYLPRETYGQTDTLSEVYLGLVTGWDFKVTKPAIQTVSLSKAKYDSVFAWNPWLQTFVEWSGTNAKNWNYDPAANGRYKIRFLVDNLLDTLIPPYNDMGSYIGFIMNPKLINKPVAEIVDTVGNQRLVTLILNKRNNLILNTDTSQYIIWPANRPPWREVIKSANQVFANFEQNYRFKKYTP